MRGVKTMNKGTKSTKKNRYGYNQFFESRLGYDEFVEAVMMATDADDLPMTFEIEQPEMFTLNDIKSLSKQFKQDTGLNIEFHMSTCNHCDRLHCIMIVDELPEWKMECDCS